MLLFLLKTSTHFSSQNKLTIKKLMRWSHHNFLIPNVPNTWNKLRLNKYLLVFTMSVFTISTVRTLRTWEWKENETKLKCEIVYILDFKMFMWKLIIKCTKIAILTLIISGYWISVKAASTNETRSQCSGVNSVIYIAFIYRNRSNEGESW